MEVEVRRVPGERTCFVALPMQVIYLLQESGKDLPSFLVLDIRLLSKETQGTTQYYLAWAGACSISNAIEVPEKLAECIGLPTNAKVLLKVRKNFAEAEVVVVEPATEDDWEILELNAEYLENHILSKVGVVQEGQCFPVWVQAETVLTLKVISSKPKSVVKLTQGTELIVAPKNRQSRLLPAEKLSANKGQNMSRAVESYLRVQEMDPSRVSTSELGDTGISVLLTTAVLISPLTAEKIPLTDRQLVVLAGSNMGKLAQRNTKQDSGGQGLLRNRLGQELPAAENIERDRYSRQAVLQVIFWTSVARGHVMLPYAIQLFLGASTHSHVKLKPYNLPAQNPPSSVCIYPLKFTPNRNQQTSDVRGAVLGDMDSNHSKMAKESFENPVEMNKKVDKNWSKHSKTLATVSVRNNTSESEDKEGVDRKNYSDSRRLFSCWLAAQVDISLRLGHEKKPTYVPISTETIMCFEVDRVKTSRLGSGARKARSDLVHFLLKVQTDKSAVSNNELVHQYQHDSKYSNLCFLLDEHFLSQNNGSGDMDGIADTHSTIEVQVGEPCCLASNGDNSEREVSSLDSISWLRKPALEALTRLKVLLSPAAFEKRRELGTPYPGGVLLYGPQACGRTRLALALAQELEKDVGVLAHSVILKGADLLGEQDQFIRHSIGKAVEEAVQHAPSLVILDDLDALMPMANAEGSEPSASVLSLAEFLADIIDASQQLGSLQHVGPIPVAFLATSRAPTAIPPCLHSSGRLDFYVELPAPAITERATILKHAVETRGLTCDIHVLEQVAASCDGYDTADLEVLLDRSLHAAAKRFITSSGRNDGPDSVTITGSQREQIFNYNGRTSQLLPPIEKRGFEVLKEDLDNALENFVPAAMRGIFKGGKESKCAGWEDVGGLNNVRHALQETLELPLKYGKLFSNAPLRLRSNVLLYGPPGCGKTHIVSAAAAAASLRFISVKGPELLNKYIGASEQAVRDIFAKAAAAAPCILFFDEFDAIAPRRGHDNTGVTDRVVNQLLTELDGVESLQGVFVFAATSRPDLIDAALLRPGRLDRLLYCDFPSYQERLEILQVLSRKIPLEADIDLHVIAEITEGLSGADLQSIFSDAQLESVHSFLDAEQSGTVVSASPNYEKLRLTMATLRSVAMKARPSVPEAERRRLASIYGAFLGGRSPGAAKQMQDIKGKKATLA